MTFSLAVCHESLLAAWEPALEVLLALVDALVNSKVSTLGEGLVADLTDVRFLLGVSPHVCLQSVVPRKFG